MKLLFVCFLGSIALAMAGFRTDCPAGQEHGLVPISYGSVEVNYCVSPGPSCEEPIPTKREIFRCGGYESCQCIHPTVKDTVSGKCVAISECPNKKQN